MTFFSRRRRARRRQIREMAEKADRHLEQSRELTARMNEVADRLDETTTRNHIAEGIEETYKLRWKKWLPWTR